MNEDMQSRRAFRRRRDMDMDDTNNLFGSSSITISNQNSTTDQDNFRPNSSSFQDMPRDNQRSSKTVSSGKIQNQIRKSLSAEPTKFGNFDVNNLDHQNQVSGQTKSLSMVVTINKTSQDQKAKNSSKLIELVSLLSIIYAIVVIIFGILLPIIDTINNSSKNSIHTALFEVYIYILATIFLIYLQVIIIDLKCPCNEIKINKDKQDYNNRGSTNNNIDIIEHLTNSSNNIDKINNNNIDDNYNDEFKLSNKSKQDLDKKIPSIKHHSIENSKLFHSALSVTEFRDRDKEFSGSYEARKPKMSEVVPPPVTAFFRFNSTTLQPFSTTGNRLSVPQESSRKSPTNDRDIGYVESKGGRSKADLLQEIPRVDEVRILEEEITEEVFVDLTQLGTIFSHHGSSFFLRIGTLLFGVGHMIFTILELENSFQNICSTTSAWWIYLARFVFVFVQTFVIFKHPVISADKGNEAIFRIGFMHVIATNLCIWVKTLLSEITLEASFYKNNTSSLPMPYNCTQSNSTILHKMAPYLFPFVLEYSLLCISVMAVMYWSLGESSKNNFQKGLTNLFKIDMFVVDKEKNDSIPVEGGDHDSGMFGKSHRGIFFGFILLAGVVIVIAFFNFSFNDKVQAEYFYLPSNLTLVALLIMAVTSGLVLTNPLSFIKKPSSIDDALLIIAMFGGTMYHVALILSSVNALGQGDTSQKGLDILRIFNSIACLILLFLQVILVTSGLRRYPSRHSQVVEKPGRGVVTFLVIANIGSWIFHSMLSNQHNLQYRQKQMFGNIAWIILLNLSLPLLLFFFFHSSVCLADIWDHAYTPLQSKLHKPNALQAADGDITLNHHDGKDGNRTNDDSTSSASNPAYMNSEQDLKGMQSKSALNYLNPLIRSVSVSQLAPIVVPGMKRLGVETFHESYSQIPENHHLSISTQKAHFNRYNRLSPLARTNGYRNSADDYNITINNNNKLIYGDNDIVGDEDDNVQHVHM